VSARDEVLARVRAATARAPGTVGPVAREYRSSSDDGLDTFLERLHAYGAASTRVVPGDVESAVRAALRARGARHVVAPDGIPDAWLEDVDPLRDTPPLDPHTLDGADGVLTTCAVAIAQTGTIVLDGQAGMGRRALSLVPDYHLCVVRAGQIVGSVPEALARLEPTRPLTFISGPSATVDIEMVRVAGVHGPRTLEVILAG
jgi:L-lactate dehydrogenase complex protein LldG